MWNLLLPLLLSTTDGPVAPAPTLAERVATLRAEVDALSDELASDRMQQKEQLLALARRKAELSATVDGKNLEHKALMARIEEQRAALLARRAGVDDARAPLRAAAAQLRAHIEGTPPVAREARLQRLHAAELAVEQGSASEGAKALWAVIHDEALAGAETVKLRQPIDLEGKPAMAEIVRVGSLLAYFRTGDGRFGFAAQERDDGAVGSPRFFWRVAAGEDKARIRGLFDALRRKQTNGAHLLPAVLVESPAPSEGVKP